MFHHNCKAVSRANCTQQAGFMVNVTGQQLSLCYYHAKMAGHFGSSIQPELSTQIGALHFRGMSGK
jgi:hypothetical protein